MSLDASVDGSVIDAAADAAPRGSDAATLVNVADAATMADATVGANDGGDGTDGGDGSANDGGMDDGACAHEGGPPSAQFLALFDTIIRPGCVGAGRFCHEGANEGFGMLTPEIAIANLVNLRDCGDVRVVPCRPDESYAVWVMRNGGEPCRRPFPAISGGTHPTFSAADVLAVEEWIRMGAQ